MRKLLPHRVKNRRLREKSRRNCPATPWSPNLGVRRVVWSPGAFLNTIIRYVVKIQCDASEKYFWPQRKQRLSETGTHI